MSRPMDLASLSLDLDDRWAYLKSAGDASWTGYPSYLDRFVPLLLAEMAAAGVRITVFVVGRDAADTRHGDTLAAIARAGHEIASHSFRHDTWLHRYAPGELRDELARADDAIARISGRRPVGFRGPGFAWSADLFTALAERGYRYDSSVLPTWIGPLAQRFFARRTRPAPTAHGERIPIFGSYGDARRPNRPWRMTLAGGGSIVELPVTTAPGLRTPFHMTYLLFLAERSETLMRTYLRGTLAACRAANNPPNFLLHPLDFMGADLVPDLAFFPGMRLPSREKQRIVRETLAALVASFELGPVSERVERLFGTVPEPAAAGAAVERG
ncbi:MAG TPA: polysaccharide deacetylase family protein [Gemmatimonadales bacterium]|nr:polysaccharide deacetylase family protein [Gemmatimonadales bacterium]